MKRGRLYRPKLITREVVQRQAGKILFAFGDNMDRVGLGGQAAAMRGEPNAVGVPTKWSPAMRESCFFSNADIADPSVTGAIDSAFRRLMKALVEGQDIAIPADGLGTGLAQLPRRAPAIHGYIEGWIASLGHLATIDFELVVNEKPTEGTTE